MQNALATIHRAFHLISSAFEYFSLRRGCSRVSSSLVAQAQIPDPNRVFTISKNWTIRTTARQDWVRLGEAEIGYVLLGEVR